MATAVEIAVAAADINAVVAIVAAVRSCSGVTSLLATLLEESGGAAGGFVQTAEPPRSHGRGRPNATNAV